MSTLQSSHRDEGSRLVQLETRMGAVEDGIKTIVAKLEQRSTINWAPISLLVTVLGLIGSMGFAWISSGQGDLKAALIKQERVIEGFVPRVDLDKRFEVAGQRRDDTQRLTDARIERMERDIDAVQKSMVPRGEHDQIWAGQRGRDVDLQRQIDEQRRGLAELHTPRDTIQEMRRRLEQLEVMRRPP